jgi:predicted NodU family carbamoyl transferase
MIVLGINDGHDSGVFLLQDGRVPMCSSEERRINVKNVAGVQAQSIDTVFRRDVRAGAHRRQPA